MFINFLLCLFTCEQVVSGCCPTKCRKTNQNILYNLCQRRDTLLLKLSLMVKKRDDMGYSREKNGLSAVKKENSVEWGKLPKNGIWKIRTFLVTPSC